MNILLIGTGYWGKIYIKTIKNIDNINLTTCTHDYKKYLKDKNINGVIISTPAETHYEIVKNCLLKKKHVLVEKPFVHNLDEANELINLSKKQNKILLVDHIYLQHCGILKLKQLIENNYIGNIIKITSIRANVLKEKIKSWELNAIWEILPHDIYILDYFFNNDNIEKIKVNGTLQNCSITLYYKNNMYANIEINTCHNEKIRKIVIEGTKKNIIFNDINIEIFDKNNNKIENIILDDFITPLEKQCKYFFDAIDKNQIISNGYDGYKNIKILEEINKLL